MNCHFVTRAAFAPSAVVAVVIVVIAGCGSGDSFAVPSSTATTPSSTARNDDTGGEPERLSPPVRITDGDWVPEAAQRDPTGDELAERDQVLSQPPFSGQLGGFTFGSYPDETPLCGDPTSTNHPASYPLDLGYFPPNTFEAYEPQTTTCRNGDLLIAQRIFQIGGDKPFEESANFAIQEFGGQRTINSEAPASLVHAVKIGNQDAVEIESSFTAGFGLAQVVVPLAGDSGYIDVSGQDMPMDELLKVAQGVTSS